MSTAPVIPQEIRIELGDGTVVKAPNLDEAFKVVAKMKVDTANALKEERDQREALNTQVTSLQEEINKIKNPPKPTNGNEINREHYYKLLNEDPIAAQNYLDSYRFGIPADQVTQTFVGMNQAVSEINQERTAMKFWSQHPDFPQDVTAAKALDTRVNQLMQTGHPFDVRTFNLAYDELVREKSITPVKVEEPKPEERPNPSLSGSSITIEPEIAKAETLSDKDLEALMRSKGLL